MREAGDGPAAEWPRSWCPREMGSGEANCSQCLYWTIERPEGVFPSHERIGNV